MSSAPEADSSASTDSNTLFLLTVANQVALLLVLLGVAANLAGLLSAKPLLFTIVLLFAGYALLLTMSLLRVRGSQVDETNAERPGDADV